MLGDKSNRTYGFYVLEKDNDNLTIESLLDRPLFLCDNATEWYPEHLKGYFEYKVFKVTFKENLKELKTFKFDKYHSTFGYALDDSCILQEGLKEQFGIISLEKGNDKDVLSEFFLTDPINQVIQITEMPITKYNFSVPEQLQGLRGLAIQFDNDVDKYNYILKHTEGVENTAESLEDVFPDYVCKDFVNNIVWDDGDTDNECFQDVWELRSEYDKVAFNKCKQLTFEEFYNLVNKKEDK